MDWSHLAKKLPSKTCDWRKDSLKNISDGMMEKKT
jgi:hypothetical protein